ncbi:MAG: hypothetical protein ACPG32_06515 [Akkermansiaceae bacterium]
MNNIYKQPIIVFGTVLPLLLFLVVIGGSLFALSKVNSKFKAKKSVYDKALKDRKMIAQLQGQVGSNDDVHKQWKSLMDTETRGSYVTHWKNAEAKFAGKELTRSSNNWVNFSEGIGKGNQQPASQVTMTFTATYRAMQLALLEVESKLPQMQLDSMSISPDDGGELLNFKTTFTVWTK